MPSSDAPSAVRRRDRGPGRRLRTALAVGLLAGPLSGCVVVGSGEDDQGSSRPPSSVGEGPLDRAAGSVDLRRTAGELPVTLDATVRSLRQYWSEQLPAVYGRPFRELAGGVQPKTDASEAWSCGGQRVSYEEVQGNAFYCGGPDDDYIAYDAASLLPRLNEQHGSLTPSVVLAHEMGHAIQPRAGVEAPSVVLELQADCFAGAWVAFAEDSPSDPVAVDPSALDSSVRAIPALRDQPGTPATNPNAHGLAFDRVNAYQTGYENGAERCARFPDGDVVVTELPFQTVAEAQTGGDLPYAQTLQFAVANLDAFWRSALPELPSGTAWRSPQPSPVSRPPLSTCPEDEGFDPAAVAAYCAPSNAVAWSDASLARVHGSLGDVAAASVLALVWAQAGQEQAGVPTSGTGARLEQVCATGAWVAAVGSDPGSPVSLSPGDIDEALFAVLTPLAPSESEDVVSSSFERATAFRTGLLGGLDEC